MFSSKGGGTKWIGKAVAGVIVLSFIAAGVAGARYYTGGLFEQELVTVGNIKVPSQQYRQDLSLELNRITQQTGTPFTLDDARQSGLDQQIFDRLVNGAVVDNQVVELGLAIADSTIAADVAANPGFKNTDGAFDPGRFRAALQRAGMSEEAFLAGEKSNRLRTSLTTVASSGIVLPRTMTEALYRYRNETRDARTFTFTVSEADVAAPTDAELQKQYEATPAAYTAPEYRSLAVMKVEPADIASVLIISEDEMKAGYERNKANFFTPELRTLLQMSFTEKAKAEEAKKRLDLGEDFLKVAESIGFKEADVTFVDKTRQDLVDPKVADVAFALAQGSTSPLIEGALSTAIVKAVKVTPESQAPLEEVRATLTSTLQLERARDEIQSIYDAVEDARANQTAFEEIATKANIPLTIVPAVSAGGSDRSGQTVELPLKAEVLKAAFASDVGVENDALTTADGYVWYEVREVIPSALRPFAEVKDEVKVDFIADKLRTLAAEKAKALIAKAADNTKLETLATEMNGTITSVSGQMRNATSADFDGVATTALFSAPQGTLTWALDGDGKTARIIEVTKVNTPVFNMASNDVKEVSDVAKQGLGDDLTDTYLKAARQTSDLVINDELWQMIRGGGTAQQ